MFLIHRWAVQSQHGSRRNAMVASTELTRRRVERDHVQAYVADRARRRTATHAHVVGARTATR